MVRDPRGLAALIVAVGVALSFAALAVGAAVHSGPISTEESTLLSTVLGAAIGALATYFGLSRGAGDGDELASSREIPAISDWPDERPPTPPPPTRSAS